MNCVQNVGFSKQSKFLTNVFFFQIVDQKTVVCLKIVGNTSFDKLLWVKYPISKRLYYAHWEMFVQLFPNSSGRYEPSYLYLSLKFPIHEMFDNFFYHKSSLHFLHNQYILKYTSTFKTQHLCDQKHSKIANVSKNTCIKMALFQNHCNNTMQLIHIPGYVNFLFAFNSRGS